MPQLRNLPAIFVLVFSGQSSLLAQAVITTFAGGGPHGVLATSAYVAGPRDVAVDAGGNLFMVLSN